MFLYQDLISGDDLLSSALEIEETHNGIFYEVESQWLEKSRGEDEEEEGEPEKVVNIVSMFNLQELPPFDKRALGTYLKNYMYKLTSLISDDRKMKLRAHSSDAANWLFSNLADLKFFAGESMSLEDLDGSLVYAYHKDGAANLTFIYFKDGLKERRL
ncbi:unnamed protein product [Closterium sp. Naga37s-1]|nr:unnamed protein product [Closterium sp. Naga37s-1]